MSASHAILSTQAQPRLVVELSSVSYLPNNWGKMHSVPVLCGSSIILSKWRILGYTKTMGYVILNELSKSNHQSTYFPGKHRETRPQATDIKNNQLNNLRNVICSLLMSHCEGGMARGEPYAHTLMGGWDP